MVRSYLNKRMLMYILSINMLTAIFKGLYWLAGEYPQMLHNGVISDIDCVAKSILKKPHECTTLQVSIDGTVSTAKIPQYVRTCDDLIRWINGKWQHEDHYRVYTHASGCMVVCEFVKE
jgi:hypothetical protein